MSIAAIILAAGRSTRMGSNKLLEELDGKALVRHVADAALGSIARSVWVVSGHEGESVRARLDGLGIRFVHNPDFALGLSTSLKAGVMALPAEAKGVVVLLGDMPRVTSEVINFVIQAFEAQPQAIAAVPVYQGEWGNPVLLSRSLFGAVAALQGDAGARKLLNGRAGEVLEVPVTSDAILIDLDTPEALAKARMRSEI
jgi:molybdenum cofactor cytidylyltransferase